MTNHPIIPPPELVQDWLIDGSGKPSIINYLATEAARWGADQELEACCEWFIRDWTDIETADRLRAARRPKPPSLKEQALTDLAAAYNDDKIDDTTHETIFRALKALPDD
jgi:hypothetical protein